ncbi:MAG: hypothetical protein H7146_11645 [Burkholderiaceae bacterium]|nr:hypothetical protein [Microbacteriaceae bacterium]
MPDTRRLLAWRATRACFAVGTTAFLMGVLQGVLDGWAVSSWVLIGFGVVLVVAATFGPWDSPSSGRNRSVLGLRARSGPDKL